MTNSYWAVFQSGNVAALCPEREDALEYMRLNGGEGMEQCRSLDQLFQALQRHRASYQQQVAEDILSVMSVDAEWNEQCEEAYTRMMDKLAELGFTKENAEKMLEDLKQGTNDCTATLKQYGINAVNTAGDLLGNFAARLRSFGVQQETEDTEE